MTQRVPKVLDVVDDTIVHWLARLSVPILRIGMGIVYTWFGVLKFFPGFSPAEGLAVQTIGVMSFGLISPRVSLVLVALLETVIGLGFLTGRYIRVTLLLLAFQMVGTLTPLIFFPAQTFNAPWAPTLEGQYIIKNVVLIGAAMVIGATVRGGHMVAEPDEEREEPRGDGWSRRASEAR
jgi:uncharacterized membrane protein YphA (DoxX/SURF4 family)